MGGGWIALWRSCCLPTLWRLTFEDGFGPQLVRLVVRIPLLEPARHLHRPIMTAPTDLIGYAMLFMAAHTSISARTHKHAHRESFVVPWKIGCSTDSEKP